MFGSGGNRVLKAAQIQKPTQTWAQTARGTLWTGLVSPGDRRTLVRSSAQTRTGPGVGWVPAQHQKAQFELVLI